MIRWSHSRRANLFVVTFVIIKIQHLYFYTIYKLIYPNFLTTLQHCYIFL